jgi:molecular chaperone GrpE
MTGRDAQLPSDIFDSLQKTDDETQEDLTEPEESPEGPVAQLIVELEAIKAESEEWRDRFLRKAAELENFRKRTDKEKPELAVSAKSSVLLEILPVMDACERAMQSFDGVEMDQEELGQYREGVELLYKQLGNTLNRLGVVPIEAQGEEFDPHLHEALSREETTEYGENIVTRELRRGYLYQDRLLRPSQVIVAIRPRELEVAES